MKKFIYLKVVSIFVLFLCTFSFLILFIKKSNIKKIEIENYKTTEQIFENIITEESEEKLTFQDDCIGAIKIPSIDVQVYQGTSQEVLKYWIGHFENTPIWNGNIALASHNEGSYAHYFSRINELGIGEEIIYISNMGERRYIVQENKTIEETNVKVLENTKDNIITLITCVKGKRNLRRCVIGKEEI